MERVVRALIVALVGCGVAAAGGPVAERAKFSGPPDKLERLEGMTRGECLPEAGQVEVGVPGTARVAYVAWCGERPNCETAGEVAEDMAVADVVLLDSMPFPEVVEYYRERLALDGYTEYQAGKEGRKKAVFLQGPAQGCGWRGRLYSTSHVIVEQSRDLWRDSGYKVMIDIHQHTP